MNDSRDRILDRVRAAIKRKAPRRAPMAGPVPWFPELPGDSESLIARFQKELEALKGEFLRAATPELARQMIRELCDRNNFKSIAATDDPLLRDLFQGHAVRWIGTGSDAGASLDPVDLGVTRADALAARTGSILLTSRSGSGRALSVLPPVHLVVATRQELVVDLAGGLEIWQKKHAGDRPSHSVVITGPSRTADIEKVLVLGAHGPKRLITLWLA